MTIRCMRSMRNASAASRARGETEERAARVLRFPAADGKTANHNTGCRTGARSARPRAGSKKAAFRAGKQPFVECRGCRCSPWRWRRPQRERRQRGRRLPGARAALRCSTLAAEAAAVAAAAAAAQDQDPDQIKSAAAAVAASTSAVVMFKTSTVAAATAAAQDQDQEDHIAPASSCSTPASTITTAVCCRYITHFSSSIINV